MVNCNALKRYDEVAKYPFYRLFYMQRTLSL